MKVFGPLESQFDYEGGTHWLTPQNINRSLSFWSLKFTMITFFLSNTIFFTNNLITLEYIFIDIIHTIQKMFQLPFIRYIDYDACLIIEHCN